MASPRAAIRPHVSLVPLLYRLTDAGCIVAALWMALVLKGERLHDAVAMSAAAAIILFYLAGEISGLYRSWLGSSSEHEVGCVLVAWIGTAFGLLAMGFLTRRWDEMSRMVVVAWLVLAPSLMGITRIVVRWTQQARRARGQGARGFAIVGVNDLAMQLARNLENAPEIGLKLVGFFDDRPAGRIPSVPAELGSHVGNLDELVEQARQGKVCTIYITFPMRAEQRIRGVLARLSDTTASVYVVPDFFVFELLHSRWTNIGGLPAVSVFENPFYGVDGVVKRLADVALASAFLAVAAVPMAGIALAIKLTSPGPVFFRQRRYGLDGREIKVWKFRTMRVCEDAAVVTQATKNDPRVTRIGALLRRTSLDELPQLFNVLDGSMSLVGPRPHASAHNEAYRKMIHGYMLRHKVKPGITGLAQVNGWRGETDTLYKMQRRVEFDHQYIREWSPWLDLKILFKTVLTVLRQKNAY
jgi:putative colanic acid biosynthesis UDP-glucose lipid carrier transferase